MTYFNYNFRQLFFLAKSTAGKLLPCLLLICSIGYAQTPSQSNKKKTKAPKPAPTQQVKRDTTTRRTLVDSIQILAVDTPAFDPMDTVTLRKSRSALNNKVKYSARDSMPYDAATQTVYLYGDAKVDFEDMNLQADFIKIELNKTLITATGTKDSVGNWIGKPVFKQGGADPYRAEVIKYNYKSKKGYLSEFRTKEGEGYIHGEDVKKDEENNFGIHDAKYTTCDLEHPHYAIKASRIKVIPEKKIVTGFANLQIEDVPTPLILPFGIFSIHRGQSSGVIVPTYGSSAQRGYFLRNGGYYFGLGENADLSLTGDIYTNLSWLGRGAFRYADRYHYNGNLTFSYSDLKAGNPEDPTYTHEKDFQFTWLHYSDPKARPNTTFNSNVNIVSKSYLANNSYVPSNIVSNLIVSSIAFNKGFKNGRYNLSTNANMSQNLQTRDLNITLPGLTFTVSSFAPFKPKYKNTADRWYENITTNYQFEFKNNIVTKDSILFRSWKGDEFKNFYDTAGKYGVRHTLPIQTSFKLFKFYTLSTSVNLTDYQYLQTIRKDTAADGTVKTTQVNGFANAFTYTPRVGLSTRYYGMAQFKGKITAIRHVVTPTLDFSYSPDYSTSSWGYYKSYKDRTGKDVKYSIFERGIYGGPGIGRQGNIGFSLDNNLEMKVKQGKDTAQKENKIQIFESIRAAGSYNIFADSLKLSVISLSARTKLFKNIALNGSASLDPYYNQIVTNEFGFKSVVRRNQFNWDRNHSLGTITSGNLGMSASFNPKMFQSKKTTKRKGYDGELKYINDDPSAYYDFNIPWSLNLTYTMGYNKYNNLNNAAANNFVQTLAFTGDVNLTRNWKIGYSSGYDLQNKQLTFTSIDFIRQLHCWEFKLNWIPIGPRQSFYFMVNVKSSLLSDLRLTRRRDWWDQKI